MGATNNTVASRPYRPSGYCAMGIAQVTGAVTRMRKALRRRRPAVVWCRRGRTSPRSASRRSLEGKGVQSKEESLRRGVDSRPPLRQILSRPPHSANRRFPLLKPSSDALAGQQRRPGSHACRGIAVETAPGRSSVLQ
jgi:hypothetical protein